MTQAVATAAVDAATTQLARVALLTLQNATAHVTATWPRGAAVAEGSGGKVSGGDGDDDDDDDDNCNGLSGVYSLSLHIGAIFVILVASLLGTVVPILGKRVRVLRLHPYLYAVGKCAATGVMLAVAMIHMINEAAHTFEASCVPAQFSKQYEAWAFALAMAAAVLMHALDLYIVAIAQRWAERRRQQREGDDHDGDHHHHHHHEDGDEQTHAPHHHHHEHAHCAHDAQAGEARLSRTEPPATAVAVAAGGAAAATATTAAIDVYAGADAAKKAGGEVAGNGAATTTAAAAGEDCGHCEDTGMAHMCVGHQHTFVLPDHVPLVQRVVAAICMEFGVTLHSVFVGLTLGVTADKQVKALLVALVFHQLFEGLAMGSRLADAEFKASLEVLLTLIFSFSAPIGIAIGTGAVSASKTALSGATYVMVTGVFDALCGGILLYLAFTLMLIDFPADLRRHCADGAPYATCKKIGLFAGLWIGAAVMALIGKWL